MLEAYYFADTDLFETVFGFGPPVPNDGGDVETIRHPKNEIKYRSQGFREKEAAENMLSGIDIPRVLSNPLTCKGLRTMFLWCLEKLESHGPDWMEPFDENIYQRGTGLLRASTRGQLEQVSGNNTG